MINSLRYPVAAPAVPKLRIQVADDHRFLLGTDDVTLLFAQIEPSNNGIDLLLTGQNSPKVIPPLGSQLAHSFQSQSARWMHWFRVELQNSPRGPLHSGEWIMHDGAWFVDDRLDRLRAVRLITSLILVPAPSEYLSWSRSHTTDIVPLRQFSSATSGRVKAYRRLARENELPPVLLWWVSGLLCYVILDGHDRLVAALEEQVVPDFVTLSRFDPVRQAKTEASLSATYSSTMFQMDAALALPGPHEEIRRAQAQASMSLAEQLTGRTTHTSWFWPLAGGAATWQREAAQANSIWSEFVSINP